jgi:hypothetical protein
MLSPIVPGCTLALESDIADQRARHAAERLDFHVRFEFMTVAEIQRVLRNHAARDPEDRRQRRDLVVDLLAAQRAASHQLWRLLLLVAFEPELVERRRALSAAPDVALDRVVVETLLATVESLPYAVDTDGLRAHVLRTWGRALRKALPGHTPPREAPVSAPPPSAVVCAGMTEEDDSTEVA